jgi:RNA polymerase primary sigma factor
MNSTRSTYTPRHDRSLALYLREVDRFPLLSVEEEERVALLVRQGDARARERMACANLRFVVSVAKLHQHRGLSLVDLIAEGNRGLLKAVDRFDPTRGFRFITHAVWWIRNTILRALMDHGRSVRLPAKRVQQLNALHRSTDRLQQQLEREPTGPELAEACALAMDLAPQLLGAARPSRSLDAPHPLTGTLLAEHLPAADQATTDHLAQERSTALALQALLDRLPGSEGLVLRHCYGLQGAPVGTLRTIGAQLGISGERVRQLRNGALTRLHRSLLTSDLRP